MRSLRTAMRRAILGALTVVGPGCWYDNPGFKLKDSETDSVGPTTNITGVTVTSEQTTMAPTTTTGDTSSGPQVSGSETSTSTTEGLTSITSETSSTTGPLIPWDADCKNSEKTFDYSLLADTFFMHEADGVGEMCDLGEGPPVDGKCVDITFGGVLSQQVFNFSAGDEDPTTFTRKVFAARFDSEPLKDNGKPVPPEAIIGLTLAVHFERIDGEAPLVFALRRLATDMAWQTGNDQMAKRCVGELASWRCLACTGEKPEKCKAPAGKTWDGTPYTEVNAALKTFEVGNAKQAVPITISAPAELHAEYALLSTFHPGYVIVPNQGIPQSVIEIHTSEGDKPPTLTITYCPDPN